MAYSEWLPIESSYKDFRWENAEIEELPWYQDINIRYSPAFWELVAEIRKKHREACSLDS